MRTLVITTRSLVVKTIFTLAILLMALTKPASAEPMSFTLSGNGGNCDGCEWLAAEGDIVADTADAPHVAWRYFWAALPTEAFQSMVKAALHNCI